MANGDAADAAGMDVVPDSMDLRLGYDEINKTRDYIADVKTVMPFPASRVSGVLPVAAGGTGQSTALVAEDIASGPTAASNVQTDLDYLGSGLASVADGNMTAAVYNRNITETRRAMWVGASGPIGWASSSAHMKQDFELPDITVEQLRLIRWTLYRYRREVARERRDPGYRAATEIGYTAQALDKAGLWPFVIYDDGEPVGIHYELIGIAALELAQRAWDRIDVIEARLGIERD